MSLDGRVIGLIEDDAIMGESLVQSLSLEGAYVDWWRNGAEAQKGLAATLPDLVVCDIRLPDTTGDRLYRELSTRQVVPPFLFMTAYGDIDQAVQLMRAGASDYLTKPFDMDRFIARVQELVRARAPAASAPVLGVSPAIRRVEHLLSRVASLPSPVLLTGETGVGKEVCARFLHEVSPRARAPIVAVNCAALPADLMESQLFGHEKGAFTGAHGLHRGFAERAGDGILFLDEIGELTVPLQAKLLRLIEDRSFTRLGGERPVPFSARIVCASNCDLDQAVAAGTFRIDLLHRINTIRVHVPPLRERLEDVEGLMELFFGQACEAAGSGPRGFSSTACDAALEYDWPGNARELRNRVERAVALAVGDWIMPADLFPELHAEAGAADGPFSKLSDVRAAAERRQIARALRRTAGNATEAAALLGVSRTTLWEKIRRLGISTSD